MRRSLLFGLFVSLAYGVGAMVGCQDDTRPPVSDGAGSGGDAGKITDGSSTVSDGSLADGGTAPAINLKGYDLSGIVAEGDTAYVTGINTNLDGGAAAGAPGLILRVDADGGITSLHEESNPVILPVKVGNTLVYVRANGGGTGSNVLALDLDHLDQAPQTLIASISPIALAVSGTSIYLYRGVDANTSEVDELAIGGSPTTVTTIPTTGYASASMTTSSSDVFVGFADFTETIGAIYSAPLSGGAAQPLGDAGDAGMDAVDSVTFATGRLFYEEENAATAGIYSIAATGGPRAPVLANQSEPLYPFVVSDGFVYYVDSPQHEAPYVARVPIVDGGSVAFVVLLTLMNGSAYGGTMAAGATEIFVLDGDQIDRIKK